MLKNKTKYKNLQLTWVTATIIPKSISFLDFHSPLLCDSSLFCRLCLLFCKLLNFFSPPVAAAAVAAALDSSDRLLSTLSTIITIITIFNTQRLWLADSQGGGALN